LLKDRWRTDSSSPSFHPGRGNAAATGQPQSRASHGLEQFFASIEGEENLSILDFAGASQANVSFITALGHRIYSNDVLRSLEETFGTDGEFLTNQTDPERARAFLQESLEFPEQQFGGALVWDTLQFLAPPLLEATVDRLYEVLRPNSYLLAFFQADEKARTAPLFSYRIVEKKTMSLTPRGQARPVQYFNNRSLEKLFQKFQSVKFFLTRDHLREVIVRR